jgi:hypothetical protein
MTPNDNHRLIPGGVVPVFDSVKGGLGSLFGETSTIVKKETVKGKEKGKEREVTEFERCLVEHRDDLAYCAQFAEKK